MNARSRHILSSRTRTELVLALLEAGFVEPPLALPRVLLVRRPEQRLQLSRGSG